MILGFLFNKMVKYALVVHLDSCFSFLKISAAFILFCAISCNNYSPCAPVQANPFVEISFVDSNGIQVFENFDDLKNVSIRDTSFNTVYMELDSIRLSINFYFRYNLAYDQAFSQPFFLHFENNQSDTIIVSYLLRSVGSGSCKGSVFNYVKLDFRGEQYERSRRNEIVYLRV